MGMTVAVIPARYGSTRLPGKALLSETGRPVIVHVVERVLQALSIDRVIVAADDDRVVEAILAHGGRLFNSDQTAASSPVTGQASGDISGGAGGVASGDSGISGGGGDSGDSGGSGGGEVMMTRCDHLNGTSRVAEVAEALDEDVDLIVNIQGDEPLIEPSLIDDLVERMKQGDEPMGTMISRFGDHEDVHNPNVVKVVVSQTGRAIYFSRLAIPFDRDGDSGGDSGGDIPEGGDSGGGHFKHIGMYAYRRTFLPTYLSLPPTPCELAEKLEQLRVLEHGYAIAVAEGCSAHQGVDTPEQYAAFVATYRRMTGQSS